MFLEVNYIMERIKCEVYARISGYLRPIDQWNPGKQSEFNDRKMFKNSEITSGN